MKFTHSITVCFLYTCHFSTYSPSTSTALRQRETRAYMPFPYQLVSCSRSHVLAPRITLLSSSNLVQRSVAFSDLKKYENLIAPDQDYGGGGLGSTAQPNLAIASWVCNVCQTQTPFSQTTTAALSVGRPCTYTHVRNKHQSCYLSVFTLLSLFWNEKKNVGHYFMSNPHKYVNLQRYIEHQTRCLVELEGNLSPPVSTILNQFRQTSKLVAHFLCCIPYIVRILLCVLLLISVIHMAIIILRGSYRKSWATIFCKVTCFIIDKPNTPP